MTEEAANQTLLLLRDIRTQIASIDSKVIVLDAKVNSLAQTQVGAMVRLDKIDKDVGEVKNSINVIAIAVDAHSNRLSALEERLSGFGERLSSVERLLSPQHRN